MTYHIAICDDERPQAEALQATVSAWGRAAQHECRIDLFPSAEALWFACAGGMPYDIFLFDVEMRAMSGIELAKQLRQAGSRAEIVFITSHFEFVAEGYEVDALHYLVKPVAVEKLCTVLSRAAEKLASEPPFVVFSADGETVKLYEADIFYVESFRHELVVHAVSRDFRLREGITSFEQRLSADFFRVHRSYLVNLKQITRIGRTALTLCSGAELPVARGKYDDINRAFIARN